MWKASIDGLDPLLGRTYAGRDWNPLDGRIVRLGLHKTVDAGFRNDEAAMVVRAIVADERWPELHWLRSLDDDGRRIPRVAPRQSAETIRVRGTEGSRVVLGRGQIGPADRGGSSSVIRDRRVQGRR